MTMFKQVSICDSPKTPKRGGIFAGLRDKLSPRKSPSSQVTKVYGVLGTPEHALLTLSSVLDAVTRNQDGVFDKMSKQVGIYRVSAHKNNLEGWITKAKNGEIVFEDPIMVAEGIKSLLRNAMPALLDQGSAVQFLNTFSCLPRVDQTLEKVGEFIAAAKDQLAQSVLKSLFLHLNKLSGHSVGTLMDPFNLGVVFGPNLVGESSDVSALANFAFQNKSVEILIARADTFFSRP